MRLAQHEPVYNVPIATIHQKVGAARTAAPTLSPGSLALARSVGDVGTMERPLRVLVPLDGSPRAEVVIAGVGSLLGDLRPPSGAAARFVCVIDPYELAIAHLEESSAVARTSIC
jgi:hypothetical protein